MYILYQCNITYPYGSDDTMYFLFENNTTHPNCSDAAMYIFFEVNITHQKSSNETIYEVDINRPISSIDNVYSYKVNFQPTEGVYIR